MNIGELRSEIKNLAFEEQSSMQEYAEIVNEAINRAILEIHLTVRPILGMVSIEQQEPSSREFIRYEMKELANDFLSFSDKVTLETNDRYIEAVPYRTEGRTTLLLPGRETGVFTVWYKRRPIHISADTAEADELELDEDLHILVPLLSSFYVWLDDDERKSTMYFNRYDELKKEILMKTAEKPMAVITGGRSW